MAIYQSRSHRRHPRRASITLGPLTISANPWFFAITAGALTWLCIIGALAGSGA